MGFIRSLFCKHQWDGGWERSSHRCGRCGTREPHEWVAVEPKAELAGRAPGNPVATQVTYRCAICGAMKLG
jgi:DNA-directed RNA polymerase subunit RPC12/RpoP